MLWLDATSEQLASYQLVQVILLLLWQVSFRLLNPPFTHEPFGLTRSGPMYPTFIFGSVFLSNLLPYVCCCGVACEDNAEVPVLLV